MATLTLIHSANGNRSARPREYSTLSPFVQKAMRLEQIDVSAAAILDTLIDDAIKRAVGVPVRHHAEKLAQNEPASTAATAARAERFSIFFDRLASGPKRTFWHSNTGIQSQEYYAASSAAWTSKDIDPACDRIAAALRPHIGLGAPMEFQCSTSGQYNFNHGTNGGPKRCLYLSLCAVSGRLRAEMGIGCDVDLPERIRTFLLLELPRCAASWE